MQQLQQERRKREEDYHRRQNNWPGFNDGAPSPGLVGPGGQVGQGGPGGPPVTNNYVETLWDNPASNGLWGTIGNVWPSTVFNSGFNERNRETENLGLDSLSLSSIWSAGAGGHQEEADNTWSSLFSDNKKDM